MFGWEEFTMDAITALFTLSLFAFFSFLAILVSSLNNKDTFKDNKPILISSFLSFIAFLMLYFVFLMESKMIDSSILFFLFILFYFCSILNTINLVLNLNKENPKHNNKILLVLFVSLVLVFIIRGFNNSYLVSAIFLLLLTILPFSFIIYAQIIQKQNIVIVFLFQSIFIVLICILQMIFILTGVDTSSFDHLSDLSLCLMMSIFVIIITIFISYHVEKERYQKNLLKLNELSLKLTLNKIKIISETDILTTVPNRYKLTVDLQSIFDQYNDDNNDEFSIMMIDIDDFKSINDTYGHVAGDRVLKFIANEIKYILCESTIFGRWGGDEFLMIFPHKKEDYCFKMKQKICEIFNSTACPYINKNISISIGYSMMQPHLTIDELLHFADVSMYKDKSKH